MVASSLRNSTRKVAFPPMMIRTNGKKKSYPLLPASPLVKSQNTNNLFDPVYSGNRNRYVKTLKNRYKNRNARLRILNRTTNINVNTKKAIRRLL
jgi:hypothetical protein